MFGRRVGLALAMVFALGGGLVPVVARAADEPTEKAFLAGVEKARGLLASGKAADGLKLAQELLKTHAEKDYVRAKRADLEDLFKRLSFGVRCPTPAPKDVVKGKLVSYMTNPVRVKIVYTPQFNDFQENGGLRIFPAPFAGPHSIQIKGASYPPKTQDSPQVIVGMDRNEKTGDYNSWTVVFGTTDYSAGSADVLVTPKIVRREGEERTVLVEKEAVVVKPREPYKLDVDVTATGIASTANGKTVAKCAKPAGVFGYLGFDCPGWQEVTIEGAVEPSWIQRKIDDIVQENLATFEKGFEVRTLLPAWLYEDVPAGESATAPSEEPGASWPAELETSHWSDVAEIGAKIVAGEYAEALERIASLRRAGCAEANCAFLAAGARYGQGDYVAALADLDRTLELVPGFPDALLKRGLVLGRLGREADAETALRAAVAARASDVDVVEEASMSLLLAGRSDTARSVLEDATRRGLRSERLDALARLVIKVTRGPDWAKSFEYKSTNYHVMSDIDAETCRQAGLVLEEALAAFKVNLQSLERSAPRQFRVYLFRGQGGFMNYMADVSLSGGGGNPRAAGVYSPYLKQLLIWNLPSREEMMRTVRHEGFHQYLDRLLPDSPAWLNEGLATYYENMGTVSGQKYGAAHHDQLRILEEKRMLPAEEFLFQSHRDFMKQPDRSYAQGWLLVHMLRHGTTAQKDLFKALLTRLKTQTPFEAVRATFPPEVVSKLDAQLQAHAQGLAKAK